MLLLYCSGAFCGVCPRGRSEAIYPLDTLTILPDQVVKKEQTLPHISEALRMVYLLDILGAFGGKVAVTVSDRIIC